MGLLLHIDTATEYGAIAISEGDKVLYAVENNNQKEHASFLHPAINELLAACSIRPQQLDGISVVIGPGSYTGLRVGLSAAKGLCYALQKPLIAVNTLQAIALATQESVNVETTLPILYAPMIDARRMEVFTALYNNANVLHKEAEAVELSGEVFINELQKYFIVACGNGSKKFRNVHSCDNLLIYENLHQIRNVASIADSYFRKKVFENIAYCEPFYLKPFYTTAAVKNN